MYECLVGLPPFYSDNIPKLYQDIKEGVLKYPPSLSPEAKSILKVIIKVKFRVYFKEIQGKDLALKEIIQILKSIPSFNQ